MLDISAEDMKDRKSSSIKRPRNKSRVKRRSRTCRKSLHSKLEDNKSLDIHSGDQNNLNSLTVDGTLKGKCQN